jgi:PKD repeat protein
MLAGCSTGSGSTTPVADAESTPAVELDVQFMGSNDAGLEVKFFVINAAEFDFQSFQWNFGDGETSTATSPMHSYARGGLYEVTVEAVDLNGNLSSMTFDVPLNDPPEISIVLVEAVEGVSMAYTFAAEATDLESVPTDNDFVWHFGDGQTATGSTVSHTYTEPGIFNLTVTYTDEAGDSATAITSVNVAPPPPPEDPQNGSGVTPDADPVGDDSDPPIPDADPGSEDSPTEEPGDETGEPAPDGDSDPMDDAAADVIQDTLASGVLHNFEQPLTWMDGVFMVHATGSDVAYFGNGALELRLLEQGDLGAVLGALKSLFLMFYENSPEVYVRWYQNWDRDVQFDLSRVRSTVQSTLDALAEPPDAETEAFIWEVVDKLEAQPDPPTLATGWHCIQIQLYHNTAGAADGRLNVLADGVSIFELDALAYPEDNTWIDAIAAPFLEGQVVETDAEITRIDDLEFHAVPISCQ